VPAGGQEGDERRTDQSAGARDQKSLRTVGKIPAVRGEISRRDPVTITKGLPQPVFDGPAGQGVCDRASLQTVFDLVREPAVLEARGFEGMAVGPTSEGPPDHSIREASTGFAVEVFGKPL
jgi:hypothetical protein